MAEEDLVHCLIKRFQRLILSVVAADDEEDRSMKEVVTMVSVMAVLSKQLRPEGEQLQQQQGWIQRICAEQNLGMHHLIFRCSEWDYDMVFFFIHSPSTHKHLCCWWLIWPIQNDAKNLKDFWNPGKWVLIWEYSVTAFQWIPTWQGLDSFWKSLHACALDKGSLSIGRVKSYSCNCHPDLWYFWS